MNFNEWLNSVPKEITGDMLWKVEAYRLAHFSPVDAIQMSALLENAPLL